MGSGTDSLTWLALGTALTLAGLLATVLVWSRRGAGHGLRAAAWSLLPLAAALTGLLRLLAEIADALTDWAVRLVFSPSVWLGVVVAGAAVVLWVVGGVVLARQRRRGGAPARPAGPAPVAPPGATQPQSLPRKGRQESVVEDQDDIEAILRKHGIQ